MSSRTSGFQLSPLWSLSHAHQLHEMSQQLQPNKPRGCAGAHAVTLTDCSKGWSTEARRLQLIPDPPAYSPSSNVPRADSAPGDFTGNTQIDFKLEHNWLRFPRALRGGCAFVPLKLMRIKTIRTRQTTPPSLLKASRAS